MKGYTALITAAIICFVLSVGCFVRVYFFKKNFDVLVKSSLMTSEGYDQKFIGLVNKMEADLASKATFGYVGGKDPMTGRVRTVAKPKPVAVMQTKKNNQVEEAPVDPFMLTAIIYGEETKKYTAIIMMHERSFAVEEGDKVGGRQITRIIKDRIFMENDSLMFFYDVTGQSGSQKKKGYQEH